MPCNCGGKVVKRGVAPRSTSLKDAELKPERTPKAKAVFDRTLGFFGDGRARAKAYGLHGFVR